MTARDINLFTIAFRRNPKHAKSLLALFAMIQPETKTNPVRQTPTENLSFTQTYRFEFECDNDKAAYFMDCLKSRFADYSTSILDTFAQRQGNPWRMTAGEAFNIRVVGPWGGLVRATKVEPTGFSLEILQGHSQAGHLYFRVFSNKPHKLCLEVESWAKSQEGLVQLAYLGNVQPKRSRQPLWQIFCERAIQDFGGLQTAPVQIRSKVLPKLSAVDSDHIGAV